jgi:hypothetical protein
VTGARQLPQDAHHLALTDKVVEGFWPHAGRQWGRGLGPGRDWKQLALICHRG